ncbi:outer membrane lipoprotein carrier protein LolA [Niveibacterium sp. COAC-50]|uniref:outer membrane lipoprotein carrier protein LolA n=1 Tax=Niveibacterium sp. COAC-50 TaxID=2729384 RepID=UPI001554A1CE
MIRLLCALSLSLVATVAHAADPLVDKVRGLLQQPPVVSGRFEQVRELSGFPKPVASRGRFIVARDRGVLWQTEAPFASSVRLTKGEILQKAGDTVTMRMSADKEPAVRAINGVMFALLSGDIAQLEQRFTVTGKVDGNRWSLSLAPREASMAQVLSKIDLAGQRFVESVDMLDANGDRTRIRLLDIVPAAALGKAEAAQFD